MNLDISELTEYTAKLQQCFSPAGQTEVLRAVGRRIGQAGVRYAAEYPEPSRKPLPKIYPRVTKKGVPYLSKFKSQKQQGKIFALAAEGKIPTIRSGKLGQSMTYVILSVSPSSVVTEIGTNLPYSPFVLDEERQANYHKGTWLTLPKRMQVNAAKLRNVVATAFTVEIDKRLT